MFECHFTPLQGAKYVKRVQVWLMGWGLRRELSGTGGGMACATGCVGFAEGVVPRKRHDGVCSTTLRALRGRKRRSYDVKRPVQPRSRHLTAGVPTPSANPRLKTTSQSTAEVDTGGWLRCVLKLLIIICL